MRFLIALAFMFSCASAAAAVFKPEHKPTWDEFKVLYNKKYVSVAEETFRRSVFESNMEFIHKHNLEAASGKHTFTLGMNHFGDLTNQEFNGNKGPKMEKAMLDKAQRTIFKPSDVEIRSSVDWITEGYVTPVKNQGSCGASWAFSAVAALEGQNFKATGTLVELSVQNLLDCSVNPISGRPNNCGVGTIDSGFQYIQTNNGINSEESYSYEARKGACRFNSANVSATITGYVDIPSRDETALINAIATVGPIAAVVDGSSIRFQFYKNGLFSTSDCNSIGLNTGVTIVGYDETSYTIKNSWGINWGLGGYMEIARGLNMCGIANTASYPLV